MKSLPRVVVISIVALACLIMCFLVHAQDPSGKNKASVTNIPRAEIDSWLKDEIKNSGGDLDTGRYSFYIGISTAAFSQDPVPALAMRRVAFSLMNNSLAAGDKITPVSYEMKAYRFGDPVTLTNDPATRASFVNEAPNTEEDGSEGGHDIERALFETIKHIPQGEEGSSIILLLNKDNLSQAPPDHPKMKMFTERNLELQHAINYSAFRLPIVRKTFQMQSNSDTVKVAITALFPRKLASLPGNFGPRYPTFSPDTWQPAEDRPAASERLPNATSSGPTSPNTAAPIAHTSPPIVVEHEHSGIPWWAFALLALIVVGVILFMVMGKRSGVQRPLQPVAAVVAVPKVETLPGSLKVTIGPDETTIAPLVKGGTWSLARQADGPVKLVDTSQQVSAKTPPAGAAPTGPAAGQAQPAPTAAPASTSPGAETGAPLAKLYFHDDRSLHVDADGGAQFSELQGSAADKSDSRTLLIEPGKRVLCRVLPPNATSKTRFEIVYDLSVGKGTKV